MLVAQAPPTLSAPALAAPIRAQYGWGYAGPDGEGVGTLSLLMEPASGRLVLELHAPGERLVLLEGDGVFVKFTPVFFIARDLVHITAPFV